MSCILVGRLLTSAFVELSGFDAFHNYNNIFDFIYNRVMRSFLTVAFTIFQR